MNKGSMRRLSRLLWLFWMPACQAIALQPARTENDPSAVTSGSTTVPIPGIGADPNKVVPPFENLSTSAAANKVKRILTQMPLLPDEMASLTASDDAMSQWVDTWLASPAYQATMRNFFANAFQQSQMSTSNDPQLSQNKRESYARTVVELNRRKQPFTDAITTRQYMMTTALMSDYAFRDTSYESDEGQIRNQWWIDDPNWHFVVQKAKGPISLSDAANPKSPNYMTFYAPLLGENYYTFNYPQTDKDVAVIEACKKIDPFVFYDENIFARISHGADYVHDILVGGGFRHFYPKEYQPDTILCVARSVGPTAFVDADYSDWRMVTLNEASKTLRQSVFFDLPSFRAGQSTLNLYTPHVGYFTTPSFLDQWSTNSSNSFRSTVNQALIVGLHGDVGGERLVPLAVQPSVDTAHSADPACFACHQDLDPLRQFYRQSFSLYGGPQKDSRVSNVPATFAFDGVTAQGRGIRDLAAQVAAHPHFGRAWVLKVCAWANGTPCLASDPEVERVAGVFKASNWSWDTMMRELMLSPLITYSRPTATAEGVGQSAVLARRDQICGLFEHVLTLGDLCERDAGEAGSGYTIAALSREIPGDQYGRGAINPLYVTQPDLMLRATLENLCALVATRVAAAKPSIALAQSNPDVAVPALVRDLMGLSGDQAEEPTQILRQHYNDVLGTGAKADVAWQSTFALACLSPFVAGVGQ